MFIECSRDCAQPARFAVGCKNCQAVEFVCQKHLDWLNDPQFDDDGGLYHRGITFYEAPINDLEIHELFKQHYPDDERL